MENDYLGIDLGSSNTLIYSSKSDSILYNEPTCLALDVRTGDVRQTGLLADKIYGKTPYNYQVIYPVRNGLVDDDDALYLYLEKVLESLKLERRNRPTTLVFTAPSLCSKVNRKALADLGKKLGAKEIYLESQAKMAALGASRNAYVPSGTLLCQIGSGIADIACLSLGEIVAAQSTPIAGSLFDEAIRRYLIQNQHLAIGLKSAEALKIRVGNLSSNAENRLAEIKGRDTTTSLPSSIVVSSGEIRNALLPLADFICLKITDVIAALPPELAADLTKNGLILSGGTSLLTGIREYFQNRLNIPVRLVEKPMESVAEGFSIYGRVLEENS